MRWNQIFIRKDILTTGIILAETPVTLQIGLSSPEDAELIQRSETPPSPVFVPTDIPQLLTLPTPLQEIPHNHSTGTQTVLDALRQRLSESQVLVLYLGEPLTAFHGAKLVELPTPLRGTRMIDINYVTPHQSPLSGILLAYGRRLFLSVRPLQGSHPNMFTLRPGRISRVPLPHVFDTTLHPEVVEDHRLMDRYLDPVIVLGVSTRLLDPIMQSIEPIWNGFLKIEEEGGGLLFVRASGIRISFPRQPPIRGIEQLPRQINFMKCDIISAVECMENVSVRHAEWLGVFVVKDEMGVAPEHEGLEKIYTNMVNERFAYCCEMQRGKLYMWSMHIGALQRGKYSFVFAIVPEIGDCIQSISITRHVATEWKGMLSVVGVDFPAVAVRWAVPGRRMMVRFDWGEQLNFITCFDVRSIMTNLVRRGRWAVRFLPDEDDYVKHMQLLTVGFALMEIGKAYRMRIGEGGELGDLILFATNQEGLGVCLLGVSVGYGELGM